MVLFCGNDEKEILGNCGASTVNDSFFGYTRTQEKDFIRTSFLLAVGNHLQLEQITQRKLWLVCFWDNVVVALVDAISSLLCL